MTRRPPAPVAALVAATLLVPAAGSASATTIRAAGEGAALERSITVTAAARGCGAIRTGNRVIGPIAADRVRCRVARRVARRAAGLAVAYTARRFSCLRTEMRSVDGRFNAARYECTRRGARISFSVR